eukprot:2231571-Amphidinium_carterae.1
MNGKNRQTPRPRRVRRKGLCLKRRPKRNSSKLRLRLGENRCVKPFKASRPLRQRHLIEPCTLYWLINSDCFTDQALARSGTILPDLSRHIVRVCSRKWHWDALRKGGCILRNDATA